MEIKRKAPIHKIDLWDEAHKKKDGNYTSDNVKTIMDAANEELKKRKMDHNGSLSTDDYSEAFKGALAEKAKLRGYYDEKYWSGVNVSQGITFVGKSDQDNLQFEVRMVKDNVEDVKDDVKDVKGDVKDVKGDVGDVRGQLAMIAAFLAKKFPGESLRNEVDSPTENYQDTLPKRDNHLQCESYNVLKQSNNDVQEPRTTMQEPQQTKSKEGCGSAPLPHEHVITKNAHAENNLAVQQGGPEPSLRLHQVTKQDKVEVVLYSMNSRNKDKLVAKGTLASKEKTYVVGGSMLGVEYVAVLVRGCTYLGDEKLVRPYEKFQTVRDAMGSVIAWPRSHVKIVRPTPPAQPESIGR
ncbi:uncharacterized protein LOC119279444 [Triticum dicoccoides]|nr:uncharacterized protein LOC119279444 [Triticum dicoccoides]